MSYYHLRKKYPRLSDKLEVIQTLSNLNFLSNTDVSDTNKFTCFIVASSVLQLSKTCFVATVVDPINIAEKYNGKEYNCSKIRCYAIKKMEFFGSLNTLVF